MIDWCFLCKGEGESVNHLFLHCSVARGLWASLFCIMNLSWVMPGRVIEVLRCWKKKFDNPIALAVWRMIPLAVWWILWNERNNRCFEDSERSLDSLKGPCFADAFSLC